MGDDLLTEDLTQTQEGLAIRHLETGETLATIPSPIVVEPGINKSHYATYFVRAFGNLVELTTAVESSWLMSEERQFPLAIDPTVNVFENLQLGIVTYSNRCYSTTGPWTKGLRSSITITCHMTVMSSVLQ